MLKIFIGMTVALSAAYVFFTNSPKQQIQSPSISQSSSTSLTSTKTDVIATTADGIQTDETARKMAEFNHKVKKAEQEIIEKERTEKIIDFATANTNNYREHNSLVGNTIKSEEDYNVIVHAVVQYQREHGLEKSYSIEGGHKLYNLKGVSAKVIKAALKEDEDFLKGINNSLNQTDSELGK
jgi:hypothetical protein